MTRVRTQAAIPAATDAELIEAIRALTGEQPSAAQRASRGGLEAAAAMAVLSAENAAGHLGVPKGARPAAMTLEERVARARARGEPTPLRAAAAEAAIGEPFRPRPVAPPISAPPRTQRSARNAVALAPEVAGRPRLQAGSERRRVFTAVETWIRCGGGRPMPIETIVSVCGPDALGHVRKLAAAGYLTYAGA